MAFDGGGGGGGGGFSRQTSGGVVAGGSLARSSSSRSTTGTSSTSASPTSYQNAGGDSLWAGICSRVEDELRRFTALSSQLKKSVDFVGTARDSDELRQKITAAVGRGKDSVTDISNLLKTKLSEAFSAEDASISAKERTSRRNQQQRFERDWQAASLLFKDTLLVWQEKSRKHAAPAKAAAGGKPLKAYPAVGSSSSTNTKAEEEASLRLQLVNFEENLLDEREEAIGEIAQQMATVNESFRDLAQIVEEQGHSIDMLETNTSAAEANTKDGVGQLQEAEKSQKGYRRWIIVMLVIVIVASAAIAGWQIIEHQKQ